MLSLQPSSPCHLASNFLHSSAQFPSRTHKIYRRIFLRFSKIKHDYYAKSSSPNLQIQDIVKRVKIVLYAHNLKDFEKITISEDELDLVLKLKSNLSSLKLVPNCKTYSILVDFYCKKNDPIEAKNVLDHMLNNGFKPNIAIFTTLINLFCESGKMKDAFKVFDLMSSLEIEPTINTYNCLLKGLCYVGKVEEAYELLTSIKKSSIKLDIYTYTVLMDGFCKVGRSNEAMELLDEALEMKLMPNVVTYNTLFNGYFKEGRPLCGISLLKRMKDKNCNPDFISYSTLLHGLLKWGKFRVALRIYKEMVEIGFKVDERMMNTLLRGLCRHSRKEKELFKDVCDVFDYMKRGNYRVYTCAYDLVVEALIIGKEVERAFVVLNEMVGIGFSPKTFSFNIVIQELCFVGEVDKALAILMMVHKDRKACGIPFNELIANLNQRERFLDACNVYGMALKRGVVPKKKPVRYFAETQPGL